MRRAAVLLSVSKNTVASKKAFLAKQARMELRQLLNQTYPIGSLVAEVQFDDMESFHHSKLKPLSIPLAVENHSRLILGFGVSVMPAKGLLAAKSRRKYGKRADERSFVWHKVFGGLRRYVAKDATFHSDCNPLYPSALRRYFPQVKYKRSMSRRACVVGQGELKSGGFDPLFSLNHTAAMLRANINRLFRKTWCTTKKITALYDHISLYALRHNRTILAERDNGRLLSGRNSGGSAVAGHGAMAASKSEYLSAA